jgi:thiamine-phosphate pyrophosphorylase
MSDKEQPQIYLITPPEIELSGFGTTLSGILDKHEIACVRLSLSSTDQDVLSRSADALRDVCHARDVALVMDTHYRLVEQLGLDGVHLPDSHRTVRDARKVLGSDAIVGCYCGTSRHAGMTAGEVGADYIAFGPVGTTALGDGKVAELDLFEWWTDMIELPVVAEGNISLSDAERLAHAVDFLALGTEVWNSDDADATLAAYIERLS